MKTSRDFTPELCYAAKQMPTLIALDCEENNHTHPSITTFDKINDPNSYASYLTNFTHIYQDMSEHCSHPALRELACIQAQSRICYQPPLEGDLFVGRYIEPLISISSQVRSGVAFDASVEEIEELINHPSLSTENKEALQASLDFWKTNTTEAKIRARYSDKMKELFGDEKWQDSPHIGSPLYRISGTQCDFDKLVTLGVEGLQELVASCKKGCDTTSKAYITYVAMEGALKLFSEVACAYANELATSNEPQHKQMAAVLRKIAFEKPTSFREGMQLVYLWSTIATTINYGRMDVYLGDLYVHDIDNHIIDEEEAIAYITSLWQLFEVRDKRWDQRVIMGGKARRNEENANRLAMTLMEATKRARTIVPQLTLRFYNGQDETLYTKALDVIATSNPYPMLYNDEVNIPAVMEAFDLPEEEAEHYIPFGCGEYIINHKSLGTPSGVINLLQALTVVVNHGINPISGEKVPSVSQPQYNNFDELLACYKSTVEMYVEALAYQEKLEYDVVNEEASFLYMSMLFDDCIKQGESLIGGVRYLGGTLESYGNTNTADALTAIKRVIYDEKRISYDVMREALKANFVGYEKERSLLLRAPKYGNDLPEADDMLLLVNNHVCTTTRDLGSVVGLHSYLIVIINNSANSTMGQQTGASPDGRKACTFMANGNTPTGGADKSGATACLNSMVKIKTHTFAGASQNFKLSQELLTTYRATTELMLDIYWQQGGAQIMINCLNRGDLENAMIHPERYSNLIVRVGGFSARFVELEKEVQEEILSRTLH